MINIPWGGIGEKQRRKKSQTSQTSLGNTDSDIRKRKPYPDSLFIECKVCLALQRFILNCEHYRRRRGLCQNDMFKNELPKQKFYKFFLHHILFVCLYYHHCALDFLVDNFLTLFLSSETTPPTLHKILSPKCNKLLSQRSKLSWLKYHHDT